MPNVTTRMVLKTIIEFSAEDIEQMLVSAINVPNSIVVWDTTGNGCKVEYEQAAQQPPVPPAFDSTVTA